MGLKIDRNGRETKLVRRLFERMLAASGPRHWWPCDHEKMNCGRDEMIVGAILTQNTAWKNVVQALASLHAAGLLELARLAVTEPGQIAPHIRSAGYYNLKARRLHATANFFAPGGRLRYDELDGWSDARLREELLATYGVGRETADSILLYALGRPSFVIDAYTLRIGRRHGLFSDETDYEAARAFFTLHAEADIQVYNEYHALLVWIGNRFCKPVPRCAECPLFRRGCFASAEAWAAIKDKVI